MIGLPIYISGLNPGLIVLGAVLLVFSLIFAYDGGKNK